MRARWIGVSWFLVLVPAVALSACAPRATGGDGQASEAAQGVDEDGDGKPDPKDDPHGGGCDGDPGVSCQGFAIGDGTACMSAVDLKTAAVDACTAAGLIAVDIGPAFDCDGGGSSIAKVLCCDSGDPADVPSEPPDPGPSPAGGFGDGVTCVANSDYLQMALDTCAQLGMTLIDLYTTNDCSADESRYAKYICGQ